MIGIAVATIPDGIVNGPERVLPRKPVLNAGELVAVDALGSAFYLLGYIVTMVPHQRTKLPLLYPVNVMKVVSPTLTASM